MDETVGPLAASHVEELGTDHARELSGLEAACFSSSWSEAQYADGMTAGSLRVFGIRDKNQLVGYVAVSIVQGEMEILNIAVLPSHRRRGAGLRLMDAVLALARTMDVGQVFLDVAVGNEPARRLYQKLGFEQVARRKKYFSDGDDALIMRLAMQETQAEGQ